MTFNPSTIRPRQRTRTQDAEPISDATSVADGMLAPRVLIRVPDLQMETHVTAPMFTATAVIPSPETVVAADTAGIDTPTAVVSVVAETAPTAAAFPKGILTFSLTEETSTPSGLGLAGLWARVTAVVPAKYVAITAAFVVVLAVIGVRGHRHRHPQPASDSEAPAWKGAVTTPNSTQPGVAVVNTVGTATVARKAAPAAAPAWCAPQPSQMAQSQTTQSSAPLMAAPCAGPTPSDILFNGQLPASPTQTAYAPARSDVPAYGTQMPPQGGPNAYSQARVDSVPSMPSRSPAWGGLPPRDEQVSAQASAQGAPPEGYRTAQRNDPTMIPATRGPGEYGEPGVARFQGTIDRPQ